MAKVIDKRSDGGAFVKAAARDARGREGGGDVNVPAACNGDPGEGSGPFGAPPGRSPELATGDIKGAHRQAFIGAEPS